MIKKIIKNYYEYISNIHSKFINIQNNMHFTNYKSIKVKINNNELFLWSVSIFILFIITIIAFFDTNYIMTFLK